MVAAVVLGGMAPGCRSATAAAGNATVPSAEVVANTGSEPLVLLADGKLSLWDTSGKRRWEMSTGARPGEHRIVAAPNGIIYLRNDRELFAVNSEGTRQWSLPLAPAPPGQFAGIVTRMDSAALAVDATGELICIRPDGKLQWRRVISKAIAVAPATALNSATFVYADGELSSVGPGGDVVWSK
jgi:hypothetical protein